MRIPPYYSPSAASQFYSDRAEYYRRYLAENRKPYMPQTKPMAIGGAFDSHLKRALAINYFSRADARCMDGGEYDLDAMLHSAIEEGLNFEEMRAIGSKLFSIYVSSGAYARLLYDMDRMDVGSLCMEQTVTFERDGMKLLGKPDIGFSVDGIGHSYDAKVNGFYSAASPIKNHVWSSKTGGAHKGCSVGHHASCGTMIDASGYFSPLYERQVATYGWALFGFDTPCIGGIDQIACRPMSSRSTDDLIGEVAITCVQLRAVLGADVMARLYAEYLYMHETVLSGHIFDDVSREESDDICEALERECATYASNDEFLTLTYR